MQAKWITSLAHPATRKRNAACTYMWNCEVLQAEREEADKDLAAIGPKFIPRVVKHGIAPAMRADPSKPYWGDDEGLMGEVDKGAMELLGCHGEGKLKIIIKDFIKHIDRSYTTRETI